MYIYIQADICILRIHIVCFFRSYINLAALEIVKDQIGFLHVNIYIYTHCFWRKYFRSFSVRCGRSSSLVIVWFIWFFVFCFLFFKSSSTSYTNNCHTHTHRAAHSASQPAIIAHRFDTSSINDLNIEIICIVVCAQFLLLVFVAWNTNHVFQFSSMAVVVCFFCSSVLFVSQICFPFFHYSVLFHWIRCCFGRLFIYL